LTRPRSLKIPQADPPRCVPHPSRENAGPPICHS
jgi:hypothetical protein